MTVKILGAFLLVLVVVVVYDSTPSLHQVVIMAIMGSLLLAYTISYEIRSDFVHLKHFKLFGKTIFKTKLQYFCPDRIAVFPVLGNKQSEWGPIAAMGSQNKGKQYVIRLFDDNRHFTVFKSNSIEQAANKGEALSKIMGARLDVTE